MKGRWVHTRMMASNLAVNGTGPGGFHVVVWSNFEKLLGSRSKATTMNIATWTGGPKWI